MSEIDPGDEQLLRKVIKSVYDRLGSDADQEKVKSTVQAVLREINNNNINRTVDINDNNSPQITMSSNRIIVTAFGRNRLGIVAAVTEVLARNNCNIEDISQKILQEFFALILIVDIKECPVSLRELKDALADIGNKVGTRVLVQHEDVFKYMHRV